MIVSRSCSVTGRACAWIRQVSHTSRTAPRIRRCQWRPVMGPDIVSLRLALSDQLADDGLEVHAVPERAHGQALGELALDVERDGELHVAGYRRRLRAASDGDPGDLLG